MTMWLVLLAETIIPNLKREKKMNISLELPSFSCDLDHICRNPISHLSSIWELAVGESTPSMFYVLTGLYYHIIFPFIWLFWLFGHWGEKDGIPKTVTNPPRANYTPFVTFGDLSQFQLFSWNRLGIGAFQRFSLYINPGWFQIWVSDLAVHLRFVCVTSKISPGLYDKFLKRAWPLYNLNVYGE